MKAPSGKGAVFSTAASLVSLIGALACCLPLGALLMAAGSASASLFSEALRPILIWVSAGFLLLAFVQTYLRSRCDFRHRRFRTVLLWFSAAIVVATIAAPQFTATLLAGRLPVFSRAAALRTFDERDFVGEFEAAAGQTRLVLLLSPT